MHSVHTQDCKNRLKDYLVKDNETIEAYNKRIPDAHWALDDTGNQNKTKKARNQWVNQQLQSLDLFRKDKENPKSHLLRLKKEFDTLNNLKQVDQAQVNIGQAFINVGDVSQRFGCDGIQQGSLPTYVIKTESDLGEIGDVSGQSCYLLKPGHYILAFPIIPSLKLHLTEDAGVGESSFIFTNLYDSVFGQNVGLYSTFSDGLFFNLSAGGDGFKHFYLDIYCGSLTPLLNPWLFNVQNNFLGQSTWTLGSHFIVENMETLGLMAGDSSSNVTLNIQKGARIINVYDPIIINNIRYVYGDGLRASSTTLSSNSDFLSISGSNTTQQVYRDCLVDPISAFDISFAAVANNLGTPDSVHFDNVMVGQVGLLDNIVKEGGGLLGKNSPQILITNCRRSVNSYPRVIERYPSSPQSQQISPFFDIKNVNFGTEKTNSNFCNLITYAGALTENGYFLQFLRTGRYSLSFQFGLERLGPTVNPQKLVFQLYEVTNLTNLTYSEVPYRVYHSPALGTNSPGISYTFIIPPSLFEASRIYAMRVYSSGDNSDTPWISITATQTLNPLADIASAIVEIICHSLA